MAWLLLQDLDGEGDDGHEGQEAEDGASEDLASRDLVEEDGLACRETPKASSM